MSTMLAVSLCLLAIFAVTGAIPLDDAFDCGRFMDVYRRLHDCLEDVEVPGVRDMFMSALSDGIMKEDELLTGISSFCSIHDDQGTRDKITGCVGRIVRDCPTLEDIIRDTVDDKISFFCENNQPSTQVKKVLQHGYMLHADCFSDGNPVMDIIYDCAEEAFSPGEGNNIEVLTVSEGLDAFEEMGEIWFECTLDDTRDQQPDALGCGSTWQDILITFALFGSGGGFLTPTLSAENMDRLKVYYDNNGILFNRRVSRETVQKKSRKSPQMIETFKRLTYCPILNVYVF